jgi:Skp family chaperone for outer membrane proteins
MKLHAKIIGLTFALLFSAVAAEAANTIATVNIPEIMQKSTAAQSIKEQLDSKQKAFQTEMTKKEEQLNNEEQDIRKQKGVLSPDALDKKIKAFKTKAAAAQKDVQSKRAELDSAFSESLSQIQKAVYDIVATMAKEKSFIIVMPTTQLLWADPTLDITNDVLTKLNSTLPKVTVTFKDPTAKESDK